MALHSQQWIRTGFAALVLMAATLLPAGAHAGEFVVVGQAGNPYSGSPTEARQLVTRLFLKQLTAWPDGSPAKVFAAPAASPAMAAFRDKVLKMDQAALSLHWQTLKQKTGETAPAEMASARIMARLVAQARGNVGIMRKSDFEADKTGLKVLLEID